MSVWTDRDICDLVNGLIPVLKKRILGALEHSREDVEFELATLSTLLTIQEHLECR